MSRPSSLPRLNRTSFYLASDDDLALTVLRAADLHRERHPESEPSSALAAVCASAKMQTDVPNGGFTQFFYNHRGDAGVAELAGLLASLDLPKAAGLVGDALAVYRRCATAFAVANPWDGLFGSLTDFDELDRAFCKLGSRPTRAVATWIRSHLSELVSDEDGNPIDLHFSGTVQRKDEAGVVRETLEVKQGKPHGAYREYFDDGSTKNVVFYKSGKVTGDYWPNGQLKRKESKRAGLTIIEWFHASGQLQKRFVNTKNGDVAEPVRLYHPNGQLAEELTVEKTEPRGPWLKFFEDGSPRLEAEHDEKGQVIVRNAWGSDRKQVVKDGTGTFREDGLSIKWKHDLFFEDLFVHEAELRNGMRHGKTTVHTSGVLWSIDHYEDGLRHGDSTSYWDNGRVRTVTKYARGKAGSSQTYPKFDDPRPAVVLEVEANEKLYTAWRHIPVDEYPRVLNLGEVQRLMTVPAFLLEVDERNRAQAVKSEYEDWNTFKDGIAYFLSVNEDGAVTSAVANGSGVYSGGTWDVYPPLLSKLRFTPGRLRGRALACGVLARVDHTFVEGHHP